MRIRRAGRTDTLGDWWLAQFETFLIHTCLVQVGLPASQERERMRLARGYRYCMPTSRAINRWPFLHARIPKLGVMRRLYCRRQNKSLLTGLSNCLIWSKTCLESGRVPHYWLVQAIPAGLIIVMVILRCLV